jgi:hypothetical protein
MLCKFKKNVNTTYNTVEYNFIEAMFLPLFGNFKFEMF